MPVKQAEDGVLRDDGVVEKLMKDEDPPASARILFGAPVIGLKQLL